MGNSFFHNDRIGVYLKQYVVVYPKFKVFKNMIFGSYYQAFVDPHHAWFFVGVMRSFEHMAFDRTKDKQKSIFEFFVPHDTERYFLDLMHYFEREGIIKDLEKKDNRLKDPQEVI